MKVIIVIISIVMIAAAFMQVFSRDVLQNTWKWTDELSRFCLVWLTFTSVALGVRYSSHIKIDTLYNAIPQKVKTAIDFLSWACILAVGFVLVKYGYGLLVSTAGQTSPALHWKMSMVYGILPFSGLMMILFTVELVLDKFSGGLAVSEEKGGAQ